jgi:hypothetical protein
MSKAQAVFQAIKQAYNLSDNQIKIERAMGRNVEVFVEEGGSAKEALKLEACAFSGQTVSQIVESIRPYF